MAAAYYTERDRNRLWIVPPKCGITSLLATGVVAPADREMARNFVNERKASVIATVRHPYDRIVSALYNHLWEEGVPFAELYELNKHDIHVRPQSPLLDGFEVDVLIPFELQHVYYPLYGMRHRRHLNKGARRPARWQDVDFDWRRLNKRYARDFDLNTLWEIP